MGESGHFVPRGKMDNWTIPDLTSREPSDHQTDPFNIKTSGKTYQKLQIHFVKLVSKNSQDKTYFFERSPDVNNFVQYKFRDKVVPDCAQ